MNTIQRLAKLVEAGWAFNIGGLTVQVNHITVGKESCTIWQDKDSSMEETILRAVVWAENKNAGD